MTRRILNALAVLAVAAVASLIWTNPAQAAPGQGMCSLEEWRNPANVADCAKRTQQSVQGATGCVTAPTPGSPTSGLAGFFASRPESSLRDGVGGQYSAYGVGGYGLDTYDIGCLGNLKHPDLVMFNTGASVEFNIAAGVLGAANALREKAYDPGSMWGWSDRFVESTTTAIYKYVFTPFGAIMLAVVGAFLIWRARAGSASEALQVSAWAIFIMVVVTGIAMWPVKAANVADAGASKGLAVVHHVLGPGPQDIPAGQCVLGPQACKDNRSVATRASDVVVDAVLYQTWLRAMLGDANSATAKKYGPALFDATSLSWGEAQRSEQSPELRRQIIDQKAATFNTVAEAIRAEDQVAYEHLQGIHGSDRFFAGVVALLSALAFAAFDMAASTVILFSFLIFRVAIIAIPLLGTIGVFRPASGGIRRIFHMTTAAAVNIVVFGAGAGIYLSCVVWIFGSSSLPGAGQIVAVTLVGVACFYFLRPFRHLAHTATGRARSEDTLTARLIKAGKDTYTANKQDPAAVSTEQAGATPGAAPARPESRGQTVRRFAAAAAPTVAGAGNNRYVTAATGALNDPGQRPETRTDKVRAVVTAAATAAATTTGGPAAGAATATATHRPSPRPRPETRN